VGADPSRTAAGGEPAHGGGPASPRSRARRGHGGAAGRAGYARIDLHSFRLGLSGVADIVEFQQADGGAEGAIQLAGREGWWRAFPVEYKRGQPKADSCDEVQLCAQTICLEETLGTTISNGALFYGQKRRRTDVRFDEELRERTEGLARRMHLLFSAGITPAAVYAKKCDRCSLYGRCLPRAMSKRTTVARYMANALREEGAEK